MLGSLVRFVAPLALGAFGVLGTHVAAAPAQGGYTTEKYAELGLTIKRPRDYDQIPVQPIETWVAVQYTEKQGVRRSLRPEVQIVEISKADRRLVGDEEEGQEVVVDGAGYLEHVLTNFEFSGLSEEKPRYGYDRRTFEGEYSGRRRTVGVRAWAFEWENEARSLVLVGICEEGDYDDQLKIWRTMALKAKVEEPAAAEESRWVRYYARKPKYKGADFRVKVRESAVKGWKVDDTENYILVYSTKNEALIRVMKRELEAIRRAYEDLFPPDRPVDAVSAVRICETKDEYMQYGGPPRSGGYWYDKAEELVFFDYTEEERERGEGKENSRIVLYHEAFHQYIFYSVGRLAPHSWFNEGYGDYFSGAEFDSSGKVRKIGPNPWRISHIKRVLRSGAEEKWKDIIRYEQSKFYEPQRRSKCYSQAWSMIYFLNSKEVADHPAWSLILPTYFETLKASHRAEMELLSEADRGDESLTEPANLRSREKAVAAAFEGVDLDEIQASWRRFVLDL